MSTTYAPIVRTEEKRVVDLPFFVLLSYIFFEYARPRILAPLHLPLVLQALLVITFILSSENVRKAKAILKEIYFKLYLFLLALMALHVFLAANNYLAFLHFHLMLSYFIFGVSCCVFIDSIRKLNIFLGFFIFVVALCAINRITGVGLRISGGPLGDTNDFALGMNVALPISFFMGRSAEGRGKVAFATVFFLLMLGNIGAASRGGFLGMTAVGAVCWLYSRYKVRNLLIMVVLGVLAWNLASPDFRQEIKGIGVDSADEGTGKGRIELWKIAWKAFLDNPILGVGQGNMPVLFPEYQYDSEGKSFFGRALWGRAVHSVYFTLLAELGLVGALIFALMIKEVIQRHRTINRLINKVTSQEEVKKIRNMNIALLTSLFAFFVNGGFLSALYYPEFWNVSMLLITLSLTTSKMLSGAQA
jgi:O-antigen ligase